VEHSALNLELALTGTVKAIAARQADPLWKARMTEGFVVADDAMRVALFRELLPRYNWQAYGETPGASEARRSLPTYVKNYGHDNIVRNISDNAINFLQSDVVTFGEAVALI